MNAQKFKRDRPTLGVLAGWSSHQSAVSDHYRGSVIPGIQAAARNRGCHLMITWGSRQITDRDQLYPSWPESAPDSDFVPVGPWNTDGLIVFSPLASDARSLYLQKLRADGFPVLFIATGEDGPSVSVNNELGIHQAVSHLAEHGHKRILFLAGQPTDLGDSQFRLNAYRAAVAELELDADPRLVARGWHNQATSHNAILDVIARRVPFTAVLASNDDSAIGAMQALREVGLKIPQDIAIIGFDDQPRSIAQVPPLSSVHAPLASLGEQSVLLMLDHLMNGSPLESVRLPCRLVQRQSCGCIPEVISSAVNTTSSAAPASASETRTPENTQKIQQQLVIEMLGALPSELRFPGEAQIRSMCEGFVQAFSDSLRAGDPSSFQAAFRASIQKMEVSDANMDYWQDMISFLRREMLRLPARWRLSKTRALAEDMLHQARATLGESLQRQDPRHRYRQAVQAGSLYAITSRLSSAMSNVQMMKLLEEHISEVDIRSVRFLLFEAEQDDPVAWSVVPMDEGDAPALRFRSREFPPPGLYPADEILNVFVLPLVFQSEVLGYVALDGSDPGACEVIAHQLAATIEVARLHSQVVQLSLTDPLTGLNNRRYFDIFLANEFSRSRRFSHGLTVVMVDIDHFKEYNDVFGHPAGDQALRQVAQCLLTQRRSADVVARIGGEEFALILPETDINGALRVAERLRNVIADSSEFRRQITVSLGIARLSEMIQLPEELTQKADQALYEAKRLGRNRIAVYQTPV